MSESCRDWRGDLAAFALDHLDDDARVALQAHLDGCAACRSELTELRAVAAALPDADPSHIAAAAGAAAEPPADLGERVLDLLAFERAQHRRRLRRRVGVVVGTAAAAVIAGVGLLVVGASLDSSSGDSREVAFTVAPPNVEATAELHEADYGTEVKLAISGLDDGEWYWLWLTGADGDRVGAGTFKASGDDFTCNMTSAIAYAKTRRIWVTDGEDRTVLDTVVPAEPAES
jgi:hypothetical protein